MQQPFAGPLNIAQGDGEFGFNPAFIDRRGRSIQIIADFFRGHHRCPARSEARFLIRLRVQFIEARQHMAKIIRLARHGVALAPALFQFPFFIAQGLPTIAHIAALF